jgi:poly(3-hydroxybutyrate) depolymerase
LGALVLSFVLAVGCGGSSGGGEGTLGSAGSTGGDTSTGHGGRTGTGGTGHGGSSQAGTGGGVAGTGGVTGTGGTGITGTAGNGTAGTMGAAGNNGTAGTMGAAGNGSAGAMGAGGSSAGSAGRGGSSGGAGGRGGGNAGVGGRGGGNAGAGGSTAGASGSAGANGGAAGTGAGGGAGGGSGTPGMSAGCGKAPGIASTMYNNGSRISITAANMQRRYILNVPTNYDNTHPYRLIIAFHELNGNDVQMYQNQYYHLLNLANNSAIFVAPNGQSNGTPCAGTGNGESNCGWPNPNNSDVALADAVVAQVEQNFCVDTNRIFANGWSYGGAMSYETACARPLSGGGSGYIRGVAVYSGSPQITQGPCPPSKAVAYYASHGTHDSVLQYSGGVTMAQNFATANGCTWMTPTMVTSGAHVCTNLTGCMTGYPVEFCSFNGDHTPDPDNGQAGNSWEYQNVWTFFSQF